MVGASGVGKSTLLAVLGTLDAPTAGRISFDGIDVTAIDQALPSITFTGPNGWNYSTRVEDKAALAKVKVGDKVDITWTEALVLSLDPAQ